MGARDNYKIANKVNEKQKQNERIEQSLLFSRLCSKNLISYMYTVGCLAVMVGGPKENKNKN